MAPTPPGSPCSSTGWDAAPASPGGIYPAPGTNTRISENPAHRNASDREFWARAVGAGRSPQGERLRDIRRFLKKNPTTLLPIRNVGVKYYLESCVLSSSPALSSFQFQFGIGLELPLPCPIGRLSYPEPVEMADCFSADMQHAAGCCGIFTPGFEENGVPG